MTSELRLINMFHIDSNNLNHDFISALTILVDSIVHNL